MARPFTDDGRQGHEGEVLVYHIFSDSADDFTPDFADAKRLYLLHLRRGGTGARLYVEYFCDEVGHINDEMIGEDCLRAYGGYPL